MDPQTETRIKRGMELMNRLVKEFSGTNSMMFAITPCIMVGGKMDFAFNVTAVTPHGIFQSINPLDDALGAEYGRVLTMCRNLSQLPRAIASTNLSGHPGVLFNPNQVDSIQSAGPPLLNALPQDIHMEAEAYLNDGFRLMDLDTNLYMSAADSLDWSIVPESLFQLGTIITAEFRNRKSGKIQSYQIIENA